jgi:hypothetical protein
MRQLAEDLSEASEARDSYNKELITLKKDSKKILENAVAAEKAKTIEANANLAEVSQEVIAPSSQLAAYGLHISHGATTVFLTAWSHEEAIRCARQYRRR